MLRKFIVALLLVSTYAAAFSQNSTAIDSLKQKLNRAHRDTMLVNGYAEISNDYKSHNPDSAVLYGQNALNLATEINYLPGKLRSLDNLGLIYRGRGDVPGGLELFFHGLEIAEANHSTEFIVDFLINIGHIYRDLEDYSNAINYYKRSAEVIGPAHDGRVDAFLLWNIGNCYTKLNKTDSARLYKEMAYTRFKTFNLVSGYDLMMVGDIEFYRGNHTLGLTYLHQSIAVSQVNGNGVHEAFAYVALAGFFKELNQPDSCIFYAKKGLALGRAIAVNAKISEAGRLLSAEYELTDSKEALYYRKIADSANENIYGPQKVQGLQRIITNEQERRRKIETENTDYRNRLQQYGLMAGLIISSLIGFLLYRNIRNKQKANSILEATLTNLKATQSQLVQSEKMASLGELTAGIAHEIQNPLNFVNNFSDVNKELLLEMKDEMIKGNLDDAKAIANDVIQNEEKINYHGKRADAIVKGMLLHSRSGLGQKELTDINILADEYLRLAYQGLRAKDKSFNAAIATGFDSSIGKVNIIPQDIGRVLLNLYNNAFYSVNEKAASAKLRAIRFEPTVTVSTKKLADRVEIRVEDNGSGIPQKIVDKIFQPFFTTKPTGQGTGLGLSLSYDIVKAHGGEIRVNTKEGEGSEFIVLL